MDTKTTEKRGRGRPRGAVFPVLLKVRITEEMRDRLRNKAAAEGKRLSTLVRDMLEAS